MKFRAFQGLRPKPELAEKVACVPYDVVNTIEARELAKGIPETLLRVDRAEMDFPDGHDPYADEVYARAVENFQKMIEEGWLNREDEPSIYVYRQEMGGHRQHGIVGVCHIEDYENNIIKKHEKTRKDKEDDRTRLVHELRANTGPVFFTYRDDEAIKALVEEAIQAEPLYDFVAPDGIGHTFWKMRNPALVVEAFGHVPECYVADGHHRTASAARVGKELRAQNPIHTGDEAYNWFLSVMFPASELKILAYNRYVHDLNGRDIETFKAEVSRVFGMDKAGIKEPGEPGEICMYLAGEWYRLKCPEIAESDPVSRLDVSVLQNLLLAPLLGIDDPRTSKRVDFVGGIRGTEELEKLVDASREGVAFSMHPVTVEQLMDIADAGQIMPPKSTWFEPKLRSGLAIHTF